MKRYLIVGLLVLVGGLALAQEIVLPPVPELDFESWATDSAVLAGVVWFLVAVIRKWIYRFDGVQVPLFSLGLGAVLGSILALTTDFIPGGLLSGLIHGLTAGFFAFGGVDAIRSAIGTNKVDAVLVLPEPGATERIKTGMLRP